MSLVDSEEAKPDFATATREWIKIGLLSFGGPAAQIALMHRILVEHKRWMSEKGFLNALSFCMLLPGPEAMQLATYAGWRLHGTLGGLVAGLLFVIPGALVVLGLVIAYVILGDLPVVNALFLGIKATVLVIVIEALLRVARRALHGAIYWLIALSSFIAIFFFSLPFPLIIGIAAIAGFCLADRSISRTPDIHLPANAWPQLFTTVVLWLLIWATPLVLIALIWQQQILLDIGLFFSRLAVVTFGGAYAVLAYMAQEVVAGFGWLSAGEMMDGLGLAETTPGPLILVNEFVGFIAAYRHGGLGLGLVAAVVTLWVTFVPCFLWIFAGAPYIDWIGNQPRLKGALTAISAAVVGVILNLSIWFALHVLFRSVTETRLGIVTIWQPDPGSVDWIVVALAILGGFLLFRCHWSIFRVLGISSLLGLLSAGMV